MGRRWDWGFGLDEVGTSSALLVSCSSGFSFYIVSRNPSTPSVTGAYPFLYCAAISVFLTPVPSHRCMPVRMIFGSTNACSFELLKRCKAILHNSKCRYGERGAADAKAKSADNTGCCKGERRQWRKQRTEAGAAVAECEGLLPPKHDAGTATRHYRAFWQRRCRAAAAGAVLKP